MQWVAISFFMGSSQPRDQTRVSRIASGRFLPSEVPGKLIVYLKVTNRVDLKSPHEKKKKTKRCIYVW